MGQMQYHIANLGIVWDGVFQGNVKDGSLDPMFAMKVKIG